MLILKEIIWRMGFRFIITGIRMTIIIIKIFVKRFVYMQEYANYLDIVDMISPNCPELQVK